MKKIPMLFVLLLSASNLWASTVITVTDITNNRIYQRDLGGTTTDIVLSGTYTGDAPSSVQARVVQAGTDTEVLTWTTLSSPTISGGTWTGTLNNVPQGGMYNIDCRDGGITNVTDTNNTNVWGVGILTLIIGQSNGVNWTVNSTGGGTNLTANALLRYYTGSWSDPTTSCNGAIQYANTLITELGIPAGILNYSSNGNSLLAEAVTKGHTAGYSFLDDSPNYTRQTLYTNATSAVTAVGGKVEFVLWIGSESDWEDTQSNYDGGIAALASYLKADIDADVKILCSIAGTYTESGKSYANMPGWVLIRDRTMRACDSIAGMYVGAQAYDIPIGTYWIHYSDAGYTTHGTRMAQTALYLLGEATYCRGPRITGFTQVDTQTIDVAIKHYGGTDFTPTTGITGFQVFDGANAETIASAVRQDATTIRLTISGTITGTASVRYMFDNNPDNIGGLTNGVKDNSGLTLPLEPYNSATTLATSDDDALPPLVYNLTGGACAGCGTGGAQ